jgi:hypothetical protein
MKTTVTMNKRRERYCHLGSMSEVQAEQVRLRRAKRANIRHLEEDWADWKCALTPENLLNQVVGRLACSSPLVANVATGVQAAVSFFRNRRRSHPKSCGCE